MGVTLPHRIAITHKAEAIDPAALELASALQEFFKLDIQKIQILRIYAIYKELSTEQLHAIARGPLLDPIFEEPLTPEHIEGAYNWSVEIGFKPGVTDNAGKTARQAISTYLNLPFHMDESVKASTQYLFRGNFKKEEVQKIAFELLGNELIEDISIRKCSHKLHETLYEIIDLDVSDQELETISKNRQLALTLSEMQAIWTYYSQKKVSAERKSKGLPPNPTDVELEAIAQTWSEHCKHKIFNARIHYQENGKEECIDSLFSTYIKKATEIISKKKNWCVSVFTDNAGIIRIDDTYNAAFKVETHNSPSALDPYGGALTGILGVNRDILGAGIGARLVANTNILCFASPSYQGAIPKRLMHPKRIFEGVRKGIEHGGNKSGVPTVNGAIVFDDRYLGKPLVFCGTVGIMPAKIQDQATHLKNILPGDLILVAGGRTGKDGIHGATFSSQELHAGSPSSAVQIGDPFEQKKLHDFLLEARDEGLYRAITDNGAGGFSSSIGELARLCGGCEIHLDKALLKYAGLQPWEILLSESQERMTLAVDPSHYGRLAELAKIHDVEICSVGVFTDSGNFHVLYHQKTAAYLSLEFLHDGVPQMQLEAEWIEPKHAQMILPEKTDLQSDLHSLLSRYNICSKESIIRQYDHEVQGGTLLKPLVGIHNDAPGDASIICPFELMESGSKEGLCIANGLCPRYSDFDTYSMAACAIDEAVRNLAAIGCDPSYIAILDNFCWPDPIYDPKKTPDGKFKLAQLVRANKALYHYAIEFETPIISGKDSMKNDYKEGDIKISIPPTLLISAIGKIPDIAKAISMDIKAPGDYLYLIGATAKELGGSEYALMKKLNGGRAPKVNAAAAMAHYKALYQAINKGLVASCHDCSDGGIAVALAEKGFGGDLGVNVNLSEVPCFEVDTDLEILFSESASRLIVSVNPMHAQTFEQSMKACIVKRIGEVREDRRFIIRGLSGQVIIDEDIQALKTSWQTGFKLRGAACLK